VSGRLVLETLEPLSGERKCFRMINGVLVERTVKDVVPALKTNSEGLKKVLEDLVKQYNSKQQEMEKWKVCLISGLWTTRGEKLTRCSTEEEQHPSCSAITGLRQKWSFGRRLTENSHCVPIVPQSRRGVLPCSRGRELATLAKSAYIPKAAFILLRRPGLTKILPTSRGVVRRHKASYKNQRAGMDVLYRQQNGGRRLFERGSSVSRPNETASSHVLMPYH
jgi:hypothetical protein